MLFTADQLVAHAIGDYILQSQWMAQNKTRSNYAAAVHAAAYFVPFLPLVYGHTTTCGLVIIFTHFFIDRFRLARYVVYAKNWLGRVDRWADVVIQDPQFNNLARRQWVKNGSVVMSAPRLFSWKRMPWAVCEKTGYPQDVPDWMAVWLLIIADNLIHICINALALRYL